MSRINGPGGPDWNRMREITEAAAASGADGVKEQPAFRLEDTVSGAAAQSRILQNSALAQSAAVLASGVWLISPKSPSPEGQTTSLLDALLNGSGGSSIYISGGTATVGGESALSSIAVRRVTGAGIERFPEKERGQGEGGRQQQGPGEFLKKLMGQATPQSSAPSTGPKALALMQACREWGLSLDMAFVVEVRALVISNFGEKLSANVVPHVYETLREDPHFSGLVATMFMGAAPKVNRFGLAFDAGAQHLRANMVRDDSQVPQALAAYIVAAMQHDLPIPTEAAEKMASALSNDQSFMRFAITAVQGPLDTRG